MKALTADQKLVTELLPMEKAIDVMRRALTMLAEGDVVMPLRRMLVMPGGAWVSPGAHASAAQSRAI